MNDELKKQEAILYGEKAEEGRQTYTLLFDSLSKPDNKINLPKDFNRSVTNRLKAASSQYRKEKWIIGIGVFLLSIVALITFVFFGRNTSLFSSNGLQWYVLIFVIITGVFRYIEKKYIKLT